MSERNAIVLPGAPRPGGVDLSPAPHRRATTLLLAVALGDDSAISRIAFLSLRRTVPTFLYITEISHLFSEIAFQHATHRASVMA